MCHNLGLNLILKGTVNNTKMETNCPKRLKGVSEIYYAQTVLQRRD